MLKTLIFAAAILVGLAFFAHAEERCTTCDAYHAAEPRAPQPTNVDLICLPFRQAQADNVVLQLFHPGETNFFREYDKTAGPVSQFCIGRHWVEQAGRIVLCNGDATVVLEGEHIAILLSLGGVPAGSTMCLLVGAAC